VYEPTNSAPVLAGKREAVLVVPGVGDERKVPQLINFSQTLARAGVVVMDMVTPTLLQYRLDVGDKEAVVPAFRALQHWPGVAPERVGMVGFSAGGALMSLAAADQRIRAQVAFLTLFGGYFDARTLLQTSGRRTLTVNGQSQPWSPVAVPLQVLSNTVAPFLPYQDGQLLSTNFATQDKRLTADQLAQLSPAGAAMYHLLAGDQPDQVAANLAALPESVTSLLANLSPSSVLAHILAPIYLLHDRSDQYVPYSQSHEFADALAHQHHAYDFAEFGIFQHVEVKADLGWLQLVGDGKNLLRLIDKVVQVAS
jgi:acetyl esterase/lipase